ncbi:MAG: sialidase family protein [Bryobacterales bacterium]
MRCSNVSTSRSLDRWHAIWLCLFTGALLAGTNCGRSPAVSTEPVEKITLLRVPDGGLQPQTAFDAEGVLHLVYYKGEAAKGDLYYVRSSDGATFSQPIRVNSQPESAVAAGTIRGAQLALGEGGRVHVAWNGSSVAEPKGPLNPEQPADSPHNGLPMLYARLNDERTAFEPQRNLMRKTFALDGGGTIAADASGHVYVLWHGSTAGDPKGEGSRRVWISRSDDNGASFAPEEVAYTEPTGACGCCGMRAFVDSRGDLYALFRSARQEIHRDLYLLHSRDQGRNFEGRMLDPWEINACPMTSAAFVESSTSILAAWETENKVYFAQIGAAKPAGPILAPGAGDDSKHPSLAVNHDGETLLVWMDGEGWGKGGTLRWQLYNLQGDAVESPGETPGIPPFSFAAALAKPDGGFAILY